MPRFRRPSLLRRRRRLGRPALWFAIGLLALLALPWTAFQLESAFGRAAASGTCIGPAAPAAPVVSLRGDLPPLHVVTYNLRSGLGDGWQPFAPRASVEANLRAIAGHIAVATPDAVSLNEVDFASRRSGGFDQAAFLADELNTLTGYSYHIVRGETWRRDIPGLEVRFGNALLVRHPLLDGRACRLGASCEAAAAPKRRVVGPFGRLVGEPRGVVQARIDYYGRPVELLVTHLEAFVPAQREAQAAELLRRFVRAETPTVLLGDINAVPAALTGARRHFGADRAHAVLTSGALIDARTVLAPENPAAWATYPAERPQWPLDGAFATAHLVPGSVNVLGGRESDHHGLAVRYDWTDSVGSGRMARWHDGVRRQQLARILACDLAPGASAQPQRVDWLVNETGFRELPGAPTAR